MPEWGSLKGGKEAENYWNSQLVETLHKEGFPSAGFERIFRIRKMGREVQSKPDITLTNGGVHIVSGKFGARKELEAYKSADEYKEDIGPALKRIRENLGEVFAVTYPASRSERFHLHVLPREGRRELSFTLEKLEDVAKQISSTIQGLIAEIEREAEPVLEEARRLLRWGADDLALSLRDVKLSDLESIFGGHDFFQSLLRPRLKGEKRAEALRLGAAYLFVNQVLFYVLISQAAEEAGDSTAYPSIQSRHFSSPENLHGEYFKRVLLKNYEPIYGFNVARFFSDERASLACENLVRGVLGLAPKLDVPEIVGQVFQSLIPLDIRKPLGAHYTNPRAAVLLANLAVRSERDTVLDPACGSGTLLVAAYQRKLELATDEDGVALHRRFLEKEITGIDAMAFSAHLAAVNLALQQPLVETRHVRIGTADSTTKRPGMSVHPTEAALPREFQQVPLYHPFNHRVAKKKRGTVRISGKAPTSFLLESVDLVIMNPPFTSWGNMGRAYRESLKKSFANERREYKDAIYWLTSQQTFFMLLADRFLKKDGVVASVLPLTTFTGKAFEPLLRFFVENYTIKAIVLGFGRTAFSEDTNLAEALLVAQKTPPKRGSRFRVLATLKPPTEWTLEETQLIAEACRVGRGIDGLVKVLETSQESLLPEQETLSGLLARLQEDYDEARRELETIFQSAAIPVVAWGELRRRKELDVKRWVLGSEHLYHYGPKALFAYRSEERALKRTDRLVYHGGDDARVIFRDIVGGRLYTFPTKAVAPAIRRFSYLTSFHVHGQTDFVVVRPGKPLEEAMKAFYGDEQANTFLSRIRKRTKKDTGGRWRSRVSQGSTRLSFGRRFDLAAPGTRVFACRNDDPFFLACDGFMVKGLSPREEKLFTLWMNSTLFLTMQLARLAITRGTWVKFEKSFVDRTPFPDFDRLTEENWTAVERLYDNLKDAEWKSLIEQLETDEESRARLDDGLLKLMGIDDGDERKRIRDVLRSGVLCVVETLRKSMRK